MRVQRWQHHCHQGATGSSIGAIAVFFREADNHYQVLRYVKRNTLRAAWAQRGPKTETGRAARTTGVRRTFRGGDPRTRTKASRWPDRFSAASAGRNTSTNRRRKGKSKPSSGRSTAACPWGARSGSKQPHDARDSSQRFAYADAQNDSQTALPRIPSLLSICACPLFSPKWRVVDHAF